jgi:hypothetical protein
MGYMVGQDPADAYRYEQRVLKLLQWRNPRRTWVMKSPFTITHMPSVLDVYPDAGFVWIHRDPVKALASVVSLIGTLHWMRSDEPFLGDSLAQFTNPDLSAGMMAQPIGWLESGVLPKDRLCNVQYRDFISDPMAAIAAIYDTFGLELTDDARAGMEQRWTALAREKRPAHTYDLGSAEEISLEREAFRPYQEYFAVPEEQ